MNFETILNQLVQETTQTSLGRFSPELALCATILALLFVRLFGVDRRIPPYWVALAGSVIAFGIAYLQFMSLKGTQPEPEFFTGLLVYDTFTVFFRLFLMLALILVTALTVLTGIPDVDDGPDFYTLLVGSVVGMLLMASANHLLIVFLGVEMASVPSYAMVGFLKGRRLASEASFKFVVYGAGAAGVMLYGISLLAGLLGTANLPELAVRLNDLLSGETAGITNPTVRTVVLGIMMVLTGLAFKLSVVPFHFWCPDAFEGASAEVAGFLSVASKGAAFALLIRFVTAFVGRDAAVISNVNLSLGIGVGVIAAVTATFGNLAAYAQHNMKRLLAYSTIAHAGYMLMAVSALIVIMSAPAGSTLDTHYQATRCLEGLLFYLGVYLFMNLGAFAIVALIRNHTFSEEIEDYKGLWEQTPVLCVCMGICLFSLVGLPPLGGFFAKWMILYALFQATTVHAVSMWTLIVILGLNTIFSLFYYVRVLRAMFLEARPEGARPAWIPVNSAAGAYVLLVSLPILLLGTYGPFMEGLSRTAHNVASILIR